MDPQHDYQETKKLIDELFLKERLMMLLKRTDISPEARKLAEELVSKPYSHKEK